MPAFFASIGLVRLSGELAGDLRDMAALEACAFELDLAGLPRTVATCDGRRAVGRSAHDLIQRHLPGEGVGQSDDDKAVMQECLVHR